MYSKNSYYSTPRKYVSHIDDIQQQSDKYENILFNTQCLTTKTNERYPECIICDGGKLNKKIKYKVTSVIFPSFECSYSDNYEVIIKYSEINNIISM